VIVGLTILASLAVMIPAAWLVSWRLAVLGMALLAPALAVARVGRVIARKSVETEFDRWFRESTDAIPVFPGYEQE
jgi:hypothetical protein